MEFPPVHEAIGHNQPPDECTLTDEAREDVLEKIEEAKEEAQRTEADAPSKLTTLWKQIKEKLGGVGQWPLDTVNDFTSEVFKETGKTAESGCPIICFEFDAMFQPAVRSRLHRLCAGINPRDRLTTGSDSAEINNREVRVPSACVRRYIPNLAGR